MKTDDLVRLLAADRTVQSPPGRQLLAAMVPGVGVAVAIFLLWVGWRPDLGASLSNPRFLFKLAINAALIVVCCLAYLRLARPEGRIGRISILFGLLAAILVAAVVAELLVLPREAWWPAARGTNSTWCLRLIPTLAAGPVISALIVLRRSAPSSPAAAAAVAGGLCAGLGGLLYATHCPDDSPLFVALWYGCAGAIVVTASSAIGRRVLRW